MRGIELLHPQMRAKAEELQALCKARNLPLLITETWRTMAEQDALYAQGRTKPGSIVINCKGSDYQSPHQWGCAFDFCKNIKGQEYSDIPFFKQVGALGKSIGLRWGGDFKSMVDMPHFQLNSLLLDSDFTTALKNKHGTPEKFKATWEAVIPAPSVPAPEPETTTPALDNDSASPARPQNEPDTWAAADIEWAINIGLLRGDGAGNFRLRDNVTRQELMVVAHRIVNIISVRSGVQLGAAANDIRKIISP